MHMYNFTDMSTAHPVGWQCQSFLDHFNLQPSVVKGRANVDTEIHKRYLWFKVFSVLKFNIPKYWPVNWFRFWLYKFGSSAVIYTKEYGWINMPYGIKQLDIYYQPKQIIVSSSHLKMEKHGIIGVNAGIIHLLDDFYGLDDLVTYYAEMLAQIDRDINVSLMNSNVGLIAEAQSKKEADTVKEAYGDATCGKPLVIVNKNLGEDLNIRPIMGDPTKQYIVDKLLVSRRGIINSFLTDIGISNANYEKKERMNEAEVTQNDQETDAVIDVILDNLNESFDEINKISGLGLAVEKRYKTIKSMEENEYGIQL